MRSNRIIIILLLFTLIFSTSCKRFVVRYKQNRDLRELEQKQREKDKEKLKKYQDAVKQHAENQDKATRKAMKRQYKKAQRHNNHQREFFIKRWFNGKKKLNSNPQRKNRE